MCNRWLPSSDVLIRKTGHLLGMLAVACCLVSIPNTSLAEATDLGLKSRDDACKFVSEVFDRSCGKDQMANNAEVRNRPFLDRTESPESVGFVLSVPAGFNIIGDLGRERDMSLILMSDRSLVPDRIFQKKSKRGTLSDLKPGTISDDILNKYRGIMISKEGYVCYAGWSSGSNLSAIYCISKERFDAAKSVSLNTDTADPHSTFDRAALLALDIGEVVTGDGIEIALRHPFLGEMSGKIISDGNSRVVNLEKAAHGDGSDTFGLKIKDPGKYNVSLNIDGIVENYVFEITDDKVEIQNSGLSDARFSSLAWQRNHKYKSTLVSVHSLGDREQAESLCRTLSDVARTVASPVSECSPGHFTHMGWNAWTSVVSKYDVHTADDLLRIKNAVLAAAPETKQYPQKTFVEWAGPFGSGFCSHSGCSPLNEDIYDKAADAESSDWSIYLFQ